MQPARLFLITAAAALVLTAGVVAQRPASAGTGTLSGTVTADAGEVRALRVKARNTATRTAYTVFTVKGRYQIHNLPAGPYEVQVVEEAFESPVQKVQLAAGQTATANIALKQQRRICARRRARRIDRADELWRDAAGQARISARSSLSTSTRSIHPVRHAS